MAGDTQITICGNACSDAELRFTASGAAVANVTVASTPRSFDKATGAWVDQPALFLRCTAWRQMAENMAESITKGTGLVVYGRLKQRSYDTAEGEKKTVYEVDIEDIAISLKWATARPQKAARSGASTSGGGGYGSQPPANDPWASAPATPGSTTAYDDQPPF